MAGGATMSTMWMPMPGQSWAGAAASFVAMWTVMMVAMMLPSLVPTLHRYRLAIGKSSAARAGVLTALVALGYFGVWSALGAVVFPLGAALAVAQMQLPALARALPVAAGAVVLLAGFGQFTALKARHLAVGPVASGNGHTLSAEMGAAWRHGLCLGIHCTFCCAGLTASGVALGVMDLRVMAVVTAAITAERLAQAGARVARAIGAVGIVTGALLIARAVGS